MGCSTASSFPSSPAHALALLAALAGTACSPSWIEAVPGANTNLRPDPDRTPKTQVERRHGPPQVATAVGTQRVDVRVAAPVFCRNTTVTPSLADQEVRHETTDHGVAGQLMLATGASAFGALGGWLVSDNCGLAGAVGAPCAGPFPDVTMGIGVGALVVGGGLATGLLVNAIRSVDGTRVVETEQAVHGPWGLCGWEPVSGADAALLLPGGTRLHAATDAHGGASFRLDGQRTTGSGPFEAQLFLGGQRAAVVPLDGGARTAFSAPPAR